MYKREGVDLASCSGQGQLRDGAAVLSGIRSAVVPARGKITQDRLTASHVAGKDSQELNLVALGGEHVSGVCGKTAFHHDVATGKGFLGKPWRLQGRLDIHLVIDKIGHK